MCLGRLKKQYVLKFKLEEKVALMNKMCNTSFLKFLSAGLRNQSEKGAIDLKMIKSKQILPGVEGVEGWAEIWAERGVVGDKKPEEGGCAGVGGFEGVSPLA